MGLIEKNHIQADPASQNLYSYKGSVPHTTHICLDGLEENQALLYPRTSNYLNMTFPGAMKKKVPMNPKKRAHYGHFFFVKAMEILVFFALNYEVLFCPKKVSPTPSIL